MTGPWSLRSWWLTQVRVEVDISALLAEVSNSITNKGYIVTGRRSTLGEVDYFWREFESTVSECEFKNFECKDSRWPYDLLSAWTVRQLTIGSKQVHVLTLTQNCLTRIWPKPEISQKHKFHQNLTWTQNCSIQIWPEPEVLPKISRKRQVRFK